MVTMGTKNMSREDALAELVGIQDQGLIPFEAGHDVTQATSGSRAGTRSPTRLPMRRATSPV
jgi:hypothetical protein